MSTLGKSIPGLIYTKKQLWQYSKGPKWAGKAGRDGLCA